MRMQAVSSLVTGRRQAAELLQKAPQLRVRLVSETTVLSQHCAAQKMPFL